MSQKKTSHYCYLTRQSCEVWHVSQARCAAESEVYCQKSAAKSSRLRLKLFLCLTCINLFLYIVYLRCHIQHTLIVTNGVSWWASTVCNGARRLLFHRRFTLRTHATRRHWSIRAPPAGDRRIHMQTNHWQADVRLVGCLFSFTSGYLSKHNHRRTNCLHGKRDSKACPDVYRRGKMYTMIGRLTSRSRLLTRPPCHRAARKVVANTTARARNSRCITVV